ncbi:Lrp/AsnC family transcriptional regulator [Gulosibacter chungangensis]|uniref:Lrp/AsnC family transcriptional regulator n=1 Tax=Gulosibacter chungangensis TaxID=979746 RepID=A0A7J5BFZ3_9MICO|nr:Lrp/AsnC family transcriptional regulator [Gulosibacter chungangensis]KAB1644812.1 Lrp/AsnC family transcriptional regulator [Gulosibacter chungangensis]
MDASAVAALERLGRFSREDAQPLREEDRALIPLLFRNGRASVSEIATELDAHASTISRRLNRVLADPRISLRCDIAPVVLQQPISCQWFCRLPPDRHAAAFKMLREFPNLRFCASTTGQTNFTFVIWVGSPDEIFDVERRVVEQITDLSIAENSVTARFHKRMGWPLDARGRRTGEPVLPAFFTGRQTS